MLFYIVIGVLVTLLEVLGFSEDLVKEKPCIQPPPIPDPKFDFDWFHSIKTWYPSYGSKEGYYRQTQALVHNEEVFGKLREDDVSKLACVWVDFTKDGAKAHGPQGMLEEYYLTSPSPGTIVYKPVISSHGAGGYAEATLTGKDFVFFAECWDGNQEGWQVVTSTKSLDKETEDKIYTHAKSLGFNEKFFFKVDYSKCGDEVPGSAESKESSYSPYQLRSSYEFSDEYYERENLEYPNYQNIESNSDEYQD